MTDVDNSEGNKNKYRCVSSDGRTVEAGEDPDASVNNSSAVFCDNERCSSYLNVSDLRQRKEHEGRDGPLGNSQEKLSPSPSSRGITPSDAFESRGVGGERVSGKDNVDVTTNDGPHRVDECSTDQVPRDRNGPCSSIDNSGDGKRRVDGDAEPGGNNSSSFTSICSLFHMIKPINGDVLGDTKGKLEDVEESNCTMPHRNDSVHERLSCCPIGIGKNVRNKIEQTYQIEKINGVKFAVISTSPKPKLKILPSESPKNEDGFTSFEGLSGMSIRRNASGSGIHSCIGHVTESNNISHICSINAPNHTGNCSMQGKPKLIHEGDLSVCFFNRPKTIISKVLTSKFLRRWESHHIHLKDDSICSSTASGIFESPIPYSNLLEVCIVGGWEQSSQYCLRLTIPEGFILLQACSAIVRNQWFSSIRWKKNIHKCKNVLQSTADPAVVLQEIQNLVYLSFDPGLEIDSMVNVPISIISEVLLQDKHWEDLQLREQAIIALSPLLEKATSPPEMYQFFSQHCQLFPGSRVIVDVFTSLVHRIFKRTVDFGKSTFLRKFAADYMTSLYRQANGDEAVRKFIASVHGPNVECPHPRVLQNLAAVNLAAIFSCFEGANAPPTGPDKDGKHSQAVHPPDNHLRCHTASLRAVSEYEDWRLGLAQLLQPIPFPDDALKSRTFTEDFTPIVRGIATDRRCQVHETVLPVREDKEGWIDLCCPSSPMCRDEGEIWCQMLETLMSCCCRRKGFLKKLTKNISALSLLALRGHDVAQEILCLFLEWNLTECEEQEMQIVTTLESTAAGKLKYCELSKRQEHFRSLQKKVGPKRLTLPSRSTDVDVAQLLSSGSFGNLECLSLAFTHVTSSCADQLIQLPMLRSLNLWATHFGDAGLLVIAEHLDKLQVLNLCETPVTDKGISALAGMKNLKKLNLNSTKLSPQTLETLKQQLPDLQELDVRYTDAW